MTRYKYAPYLEAAVDVDYWDKLSPADKRYMQKFCAEYYAGHFTGGKSLHNTTALKKECRRRHSQRRRDASNFAMGLEHGEGPVSQSSDRDLDLERPEVRALLAEAKALAPEGDPIDSRKRLVFRSPLHETRFYQIRERLKQALGGEA